MPWRGSVGKTTVGYVERVAIGRPSHSEAIDHSERNGGLRDAIHRGRPRG